MSFLLLPDGTRAITANRDEDPKRNALGLSTYLNRSNKQFSMAREPVHGGTNLTVSEKGEVRVLLNGAFEAHPFGRSYRLSRGLMVLDSLETESLKQFCGSYDFDDIEPFTLLRFDDDMVEELRWDLERIHYMKTNQLHSGIWASAQLYTSEVRRKRQLWFDALKAKKPLPTEILKFHLEGGDGDAQNDMVMDRYGLVRTVSVTQMLRSDSGVEVLHKNLIDGREEKLKF